MPDPEPSNVTDKETPQQAPLFILETDPLSQLAAIMPKRDGVASQLLERYTAENKSNPEVNKFGVAIYKVLRDHGVLSVVRNLEERDRKLDSVSKYRRKEAFDKSFKRRMHRFFEEE